MEQNKAERLNENVTEKMCSSDGLFAVKKR